MTLDRIAAYRTEIQQSFDHHKDGRAQYMLANLALEELQIMTSSGVEPSESTIEEIQYRFDGTALINQPSSPLFTLRARLLRAYIRPIVWSGVLSMDGLSKSEARHAAVNMRLEAAHEDAAIVVSDALHTYDATRQQLGSVQAMREDEAAREVVGFLNEATPILLSGRHNTAKQFALPSLAYDDQIDRAKPVKIDGFIHDNRQADTPIRQHPYQVKSSSDYVSNSTVPIIHMRDLGNLSKSSSWPVGYDKIFMTVRMLLLERRGKLKSQDLRSRLDRISSTIFNKVTHS